MCGRWFQLASFYPFARQHTDEKGGFEPYNLGIFRNMAITSLQIRYKYLMFTYGCLARAQSDGATCFDPLFFHYPEIENNLMNMSMESTFIVGDALKISPVLEKQGDKKNFTVFFPAGKWLHMHDYSVIEVSDVNGTMVDLPFPDDKVHVHLRPGYLVPVQKQVWFEMVSTKDLVKKYFSIIVNRDEDKHAEGYVYIDDNSDSINSQFENYKLILN